MVIPRTNLVIQPITCITALTVVTVYLPVLSSMNPEWGIKQITPLQQGSYMKPKRDRVLVDFEAVIISTTWYSNQNSPLCILREPWRKLHCAHKRNLTLYDTSIALAYTATPDLYRLISKSRNTERKYVRNLSLFSKPSRMDVRY